MKRVLAELPFENYYLYTVFHKKQKRRYAVLVPVNKSNGLKRTTSAYARYLMSVKLGRTLTKSEEVDHIDNNKMNDVIDNLQILSKRENTQKKARFHGRKYVLLKCPYCKKLFEIPENISFLQKTNLFSACSKKCKNVFLSILMKEKDSEFVKAALSENLVKEFVKH